MNPAHNLVTAATGNLTDSPTGDEILDLEGLFNKEIGEPDLAPLVPVIRGLLGFLPSERITASEALDLLGDDEEDQFA